MIKRHRQQQNLTAHVDPAVVLQTWLPGSSPHGGVQSEAGAGVQRLRHSNCPHRALQGRPLLGQTH